MKVFTDERNSVPCIQCGKLLYADDWPNCLDCEAKLDEDGQCVECEWSIDDEEPVAICGPCFDKAEELERQELESR